MHSPHRSRLPARNSNSYATAGFRPRSSDAQALRCFPGPGSQTGESCFRSAPTGYGMCQLQDLLVVRAQHLVPSGQRVGARRSARPLPRAPLLAALKEMDADQFPPFFGASPSCSRTDQPDYWRQGLTLLKKMGRPREMERNSRSALRALKALDQLSSAHNSGFLKTQSPILMKQTTEIWK